MFNSIHMVHYHQETRIAFDNVMIITVESGKKLNEMGLRLKSTRHYYVITTNTTTSYFDVKDWFISFNH